MERILINQVKEHEGKTVKLAGFVHNVRVLKGLSFVLLRDMSGQLQLVFEEGNKDSFDIITKATLESVIEVEGEIKEKPSKSDNKEYEMQVKAVKILSLAEELPIPVNEKSDNQADTENRFNWRWLDLRKVDHQNVFQVWTELEKGFRKSFAEQGFTQVYTPTFMNTASETGSEVFSVKYFDTTAYLAQSPQFYKQMAIASGIEKVFAVGTVYRAEKSSTNRHNTEFTGWDFEMAYIESDEAVMNAEEDMLIAGLGQVKEKLSEKLKLNVEIPTKPFPRITFKEAKEKLAKAGIKSEEADDFGSEEEREISKIMKKETGHDFVFVTEYPFSARPFYHMKKEGTTDITKSFDLIYKGIEITTGAQREHRLDILIKQAEEKGMDKESLADYFNFFRYGCPPHGGAGIGPARIIMKILDLENIREAVFLPRDVKRLRP